MQIRLATGITVCYFYPFSVFAFHNVTNSIALHKKQIDRDKDRGTLTQDDVTWV